MNDGNKQAIPSRVSRQVEAARRVMVEVWQILGAYRGAMVLVGGWVPEVLLPSAVPPHTGSIDVDLLLNPKPLRQAQYAELLHLLEARGYQRTDKAFRYAKEVAVDEGEPVRVEVDFLVPKGAKKGRSARVMPGFRAIEADGARLALEVTETKALDGRMPDGAHHQVQVIVPSIEAYIVMKAYALRGRLKEKDAYDIVFCLRNWAGGAADVARRLMPHRDEADVREALHILAVHFASPEHTGSRGFAAVMSPTGDPDEREFLARDAFERVQEFLRGLGYREGGTP
jgi:hypothetical protein